MSEERIEDSPHKFWLTTCGLNTYRRSKNHARQDTPWNAFTLERKGLVNSIWVDRIVSVFDPQADRTRRFVRLGARSARWAGQAVKHGEDARRNLDEAIRDRVPVFGFEVEPDGPALDRGVRVIKHFYLDRVHQLRAVFGLRGEDLKERLLIDDAFRQQYDIDDEDIIQTSNLFELVEPADEVPGARRDRSAPPAAPEVDQDRAQAPDDDDLYGEVADKVSADEYSRRALPLLVAHVLRQRDDVLVPLTYLRLAELLGRRNRHGDPWARGLGNVLGRVTAMIDQASAEWVDSLPYLTTIVVLSRGQNAGLPDKGVSGRWPGYDSLSREDKQAKVRAEHSRILQFGSRWNDVLRVTGLEPVTPPGTPSISNVHGGWGGGESDAHKALKHYVRNHPQLCGAGSDWFSQEEYALRSGDEIDVFFRSDMEWIGVEVKSRVSDGLPSDYERGLYQVVKYRAVLQAQAQIDHPDRPPAVRATLALEGSLPSQYRALAQALAVNYLERICTLEDHHADEKQLGEAKR